MGMRGGGGARGEAGAEEGSRGQENTESSVNF